ncbi:MAG: hypothetical protein R2730_16035 [Chitinophagales bacterium]
MKFQTILFSITLLFFAGCANDSKKSGATTDPSATQENEIIQVDAPPPITEEPAQNSDGVWHYTCPKGCEGGSGKAEACATCGTMLAHNQDYHSSANTPSLSPDINMPPPTQDPPQNANGVWHFTCAKGCAGGAGSAIACSVCGEMLVHNAAYHN